MCRNGDFRTVSWFEPCAGIPDIGRLCTQAQACKRQPWKLILLIAGYFLWTAWEDVGPKSCTPCPTIAPGQPLPKSYVRMPPGALAWSVAPATGPGAIGNIPIGVVIDLGPTPSVPGAFPIPQYVELDKERCQVLLELMQKALEDLRATGRVNEAQTQQKNIDEVKELCRRFFH
jgi:hypothetical protein